MDFQEIYQGLRDDPMISSILRVLVLGLIGVPFILIFSRLVNRRVTRKFSPHQGMIAGKVVSYLGLAIILLTVLNEFGFNLTTLLGAAGIASVAIGFASQTSLSNVISGLFLMGEKPFSVGDLITVNGQTGEVLSIDTLSVKIRAFDNRYIRIPNETMIKTDVINITRFPLRRIDITVGVAYKTDLRKAKAVLKEVALKNPNVLDNPEPILLYSQYNNSSIDILFGVWIEKADFITVKNEMIIEVKEAFDREDIEIPFPHLSLYTGEATKPFPLELAKPLPDSKDEKFIGEESED